MSFGGSWIFLWHPNTFMTYLCMAAVPIHATVGGTANWVSMIAGMTCSSFWGMSAGFEMQLNDERRASQLGMLTAAFQTFLVKADVLTMSRIMSNRAHFTLLGGFFVWHGLRYKSIKDNQRELS